MRGSDPGAAAAAYCLDAAPANIRSHLSSSVQYRLTPTDLNHAATNRVASKPSSSLRLVELRSVDCGIEWAKRELRSHRCSPQGPIESLLRGVQFLQSAGAMN